MIVFIVLLIFICVLIGRLLYINLSSSDTYARIVMAQMDYDSKSIPFKRGDIKDRNGTVLATSEKVYNLVLDPYVVLNSNGDCEKPTAEAIEEYFDIDKETHNRSAFGSHVLEVGAVPHKFFRFPGKFQIADYRAVV